MSFTGAKITPIIGIPFSTKAILTVNSPFFLTNSFVPSKGSTIQSISQFFLCSYSGWLPSSLKIGILLLIKWLSIISLAF